MKKVILFGLAFTLIGGYQPHFTKASSQGGLEKIMAEKLKNSQRILEGLALADFNRITRGSEELIQLSKTAEWKVHKTARYEMYSNEFRRAAENVVQKSQAKNLDGAALAYFEMTMSCIRCHQYVREIREARAPLPSELKIAR